MQDSLINGFGWRYLSIEFEPADGWIRSTWTGLLTVDMVVEGATAVLAMMRQTNCPHLLNDNRAVVGSWNEANNWIAQTWVPQAIALGLRRFAHLVAPGVFGQTSAEAMRTRVGDRFEMVLFQDEEAAKAWLLTAEQPIKQVTEQSVNP